MATHHPTPSERPALQDLLPREDRHLLLKSLQLLCKVQQAALQRVRFAARTRGRQFDERDFDIPRIKRLMQRISR